MRTTGIVVTAAVLIVAAAYLLLRGNSTGPQEREGDPVGEKVVKSDQEWRQQLSAEQYKVTRRGGTERAFTNRYWDCKEDGTYRCVCCGQPLFDSEAKYDSGTGWPSYFEP